MDKSLLVAVDLGTSFIKTAVYDLKGEYITGATEKVDEIRDGNGAFIQKGDMIFNKVCNCLQKTSQNLGNDVDYIKAIGFSGQMAGSIGVGENWDDITSWSCSVDTRYLPYADSIRREFEDDLYSLSGTGSPVMCAKYKWFEHEFPEEHDRIVKYTMLNGYIIGKLSEIPVEEAPIDYSLISWTGLADIKKLEWSKSLCSKIGVDIDKLSRIVSADTMIGTISYKASKMCNIPEGIPLVLGAGDKICGSVGAESISEGDTIIELASYAAINQRVNAYSPDIDGRKFDIIGGISGEGYNVHKYLQGSGVSSEWFLREFVKADCDNLNQSIFTSIENLAKMVPSGSERMIAIGSLGGSAIPFNKSIKGAFIGHSWKHKKEHFYRALIESFTYDLASTLKSIERYHPSFAKIPIKVLGGGAKSIIWPQIIANVMGREIRTLNRSDISLLGAAKIAGVGAEIIDGYDKHYGDVKVEQIFHVQRDEYTTYQKYLELYEEVVQTVSELSDKLEKI